MALAAVVVTAQSLCPVVAAAAAAAAAAVRIRTRAASPHNQRLALPSYPALASQRSSLSRGTSHLAGSAAATPASFPAIGQVQSRDLAVTVVWRH